MKKTLFVLSILASTLAFSQVKPPVLEKADLAFQNGQYFEAATLQVNAYNSISNRNKRALEQKSQYAYNAAYSFERAFNYEKAIEWYQRAIDLKYFETNPYVYFRLGNLYKLQGEYDKARDNYEQFLTLNPTDQQVKNALESLDRAVVYKENRTRYMVQSEKKINTDGMDMAPAISAKNGAAIVFGSSRPAPMTKGKDPINGEGYFNIWEVEIDKKGNWTEPKLLDGENINTEYSEGTLVFDGRFRNIFYTRCPQIKGQELGCQIWTAEKKGKKFSEPERINLAPNDQISVGHPLPNEDGTMLIFASDLPGGFGGTDLWYTTYDKKSKSWSTPINMGATINTPGDELFPTYALNGDLLFASDGFKGLGGLDIYRAKKTDDPVVFENPVNLGTPINSDGDDYHMTEITEKKGYFTSDRKGSVGTRGMPDIWSYELPPNIFDLKVIITEVGGTDRIEGVTVEVTPEGGQPFTRVTNANGEVFWDKKPDGDRFIDEETTYSVRILPKEGYHENTQVERFTTKQLMYDQSFITEMGLLPKTPIVLPEVRYDLGSAILQVIAGEINSKDSLNFVFDLLEEYPGMVLKLQSHTDSRGSDKSNEDLAKRRAQSCVDYLVNEKGVDPNRLIAEGKGEYEPRTVFLQNGTYHVKRPKGEYEEVLLTEKYINQFKNDKDLFEELHQYNRRTEAEVVRMDYVKP